MGKAVGTGEGARSGALEELDGKARIGEVLPQALTHLLAAVVGVITPAIIVATACGFDKAQETQIVQAALLMSGVATFLQAVPLFKRVGSGLPIVMGTSFSFVPALQAVGAGFGYPTILGAQLIGGALAVLIGIFIKPVRKLFPPVVTGAVVFVIGVSLYPTAVAYMAGGTGAIWYGSPQNWLVALVTFGVVLGLTHFGRGIWKLGSMLFGMIAGLAVAWPLGMVTTREAARAAAVALPPVLPFPIEFAPAACATVAIVFVVNSVQVIAEATATTTGAMGRQPTDRELSGSVVSMGAAAMAGVLVGGMPSSTFGQNVGLVISNRVVNRRVFAAVGLMFIAVGFSPKVAAALTSFPQAVIGGATLSVFSTIAMNGIKLFADGGITQRKGTVFGISAALGLGIAQASGALAGPGMPEWVNTVFGSSALVATTICAIFLNLVLPAEKPAAPTDAGRLGGVGEGPISPSPEAIWAGPERPDQADDAQAACEEEGALRKRDAARAAAARPTVLEPVTEPKTS